MQPNDRDASTSFQLHALRGLCFLFGVIISASLVAWYLGSDIRFVGDTESGIGQVYYETHRKTDSPPVLALVSEHGRLRIPTRKVLEPGSEVEYYYSPVWDRAELASETYLFPYLMLGGICVVCGYCAFDEFRIVIRANDS